MASLINSVHKDNREQLLRMLVDCCVSLDDGAAKTIIDKDSSISVLFLFFLVDSFYSYVNFKIVKEEKLRH
jgi:hypothetical protein